MHSVTIITRLLEYPTLSFWNASGEIVAAIETLVDLPEEKREALRNFAEALFAHDLLDAQETYLNTFEKGRSRSLILFEHVYGESRMRGQAMAALCDEYRHVGLVFDARELPDYLPVYLEYLAVLPEALRAEKLTQIAPILAALKQELENIGSDYVVLMDMLLHLAEWEDEVRVSSSVDSDALDEESFEAIDALWEEAEVLFGQQSSPCAAAQHRTERPVFFAAADHVKGVCHAGR
jgi:nitrate reductase molybdenum cofactor assembly chaperone